MVNFNAKTVGAKIKEDIYYTFMVGFDIIDTSFKILDFYGVLWPLYPLVSYTPIVLTGDYQEKMARHSLIRN